MAGQMLLGVDATAAAGGFDPSSISGLQLWLKADVGTFQDTGLTTPATADADPIGGWQDQSGLGNHVLQSTGANRPTLKLAIQNGRSIVRFDGVNDVLTVGLARNQPTTAFIVVKKTATGNRYVFDGSNTNALFSPDETHWQAYSGVALAATAVPSNWNIVVGVFNGGSSKISINGTVGTGNAGANNATATSIGAFNAGAAAWFAGDVAEVLVYNSALSDANRQSVETYLNGRWGVF